MSTFCGLPGDQKSSSRILKPPGGGHSDIFGSPETRPNHARPKYDQQNSSNISGALGTTDANEICEKTARALEVQHQKESGVNNSNDSAPAVQNGGSTNQETAAPEHQTQKRHRVPPGGHSTGFW